MKETTSVDAMRKWRDLCLSRRRDGNEAHEEERGSGKVKQAE